MVSGIAVGAFLDAFDEDGKQVGFASVFAASILLGWVSNRALGAASYPRHGGGQAGRMQPRQLVEPLRDGNFRRAILFFGSSQFALGLAAPFYSVYMLEHLGLSYTTISIFSAVNMVASISGYRIWAGLIDRFGGKPVLQAASGPVRSGAPAVGFRRRRHLLADSGGPDHRRFRRRRGQHRDNAADVRPAAPGSEEAGVPRGLVRIGQPHLRAGGRSSEAS